MRSSQSYDRCVVRWHARRARGRRTPKPADEAQVLSPAALMMAALLMCPEPTRLRYRAVSLCFSSNETDGELPRVDVGCEQGMLARVLDAAASTSRRG